MLSPKPFINAFYGTMNLMQVYLFTGSPSECVAQTAHSEENEKKHEIENNNSNNNNHIVTYPIWKKRMTAGK